MTRRGLLGPALALVPTLFLQHFLAERARIQLKILLGYASVVRPFSGRGLQRLSWTLGKIFLSRNSVVVTQGNRRFKVYLNDGYYSRLLPYGFVYEPEVEFILDRTISEKAAFIDCGANNGYWSIFAALKSGHPERVVAIEATSGPFARLQENRKLNYLSFPAIKRAIYSTPNLDLRFATHPLGHAENTHTDWADNWSSDPRSRRETVKTVTIDDVCERILRREGAANQVVVKIDAEGAEIEAFQGAQKTIDRGALFVYEDHGCDLSCRNTDFLLNECRLAGYVLRGASPPTPIEDIRELSRLKKDAQVGYNLIAGKSGSPSLKKALRTN